MQRVLLWQHCPAVGRVGSQCRFARQFSFFADVGNRCGVLADTDEGDNRLFAGKGADFNGQLFDDRFCDSVAVNELHKALFGMVGEWLRICFQALSSNDSDVAAWAE